MRFPCLSVTHFTLASVIPLWFFEPTELHFSDLNGVSDYKNNVIVYAPTNVQHDEHSRLFLGDFVLILLLFTLINVYSHPKTLYAWVMGWTRMVSAPIILVFMGLSLRPSPNPRINLFFYWILVKPTRNSFLVFKPSRNLFLTFHGKNHSLGLLCMKMYSHNHQHFCLLRMSYMLFTKTAVNGHHQCTYYRRRSCVRTKQSSGIPYLSRS